MKHFLNPFSLTYGLLAAFIAGFFCSCSSDKDKLLETVPSDTEFVATVDMIKLAKDAGVTVEDGRLVLPDEYSFIKDQMPSDAMKEIGRVAQAVDLENIVIFGSINKNEAYGTAIVKDADDLKAYLKKNDFSRSTEEGKEVYSTSDSDYAECIAFSEDDKQVWFIPTRRLLKNIEDFELARKKNNILRFIDKHQRQCHRGAVNHNQARRRRIRNRYAETGQHRLPPLHAIEFHSSGRNRNQPAERLGR